MDISKNERPVVLALALDKAGSSERSVIGGEYEVCARLEGREDGMVPDSVLGAESVASRFEEQIMGLTRSFNQILWDNNQDYAISHVLERMEGYMAVNCRAAYTQARICYPARKRGQEYLIMESSFVPGIWYYLRRLKDRGLCICKCVNCAKLFFAPSNHYGLCGDSCKKEKNRRNKQEFDERARKNGYVVDYKNTCQRMRGSYPLAA